MTTVSGIICNKCDNELPPHSMERHLDINDIIHKCPHKCVKNNIMKELKEMFDKKYIIKKNKNYDDYDTTADILIFAEFNCNIHDKKYGWVECRKCDCHYGCSTSQRFLDLIEKHNYSMEWVNCCVAGLFKKK